MSDDPIADLQRMHDVAHQRVSVEEIARAYGVIGPTVERLAANGKLGGFVAEVRDGHRVRTYDRARVDAALHLRVLAIAKPAPPPPPPPPPPEPRKPRKRHRAAAKPTEFQQALEKQKTKRLLPSRKTK